jgi:DNA-binding NarL/FixJ family response regulator
VVAGSLRASDGVGGAVAGSLRGADASGRVADAIARGAADADDVVRRVRAAAAQLPRRYPAEKAWAALVAALLDGGPERWAEAVAAARAGGQRYPLAQALLSLAEARAADRPTAADALGEAAAIATSLGAAPLLAAADTLARRLGVRPSGPTAPPAAGTEILTAREREVLRLVAEGQSNSRIAARLYISPKTASVHVSRIIAKLEVANRGEAAAVAHRLGLLSD